MTETETASMVGIAQCAVKCLALALAAESRRWKLSGKPSDHGSIAVAETRSGQDSAY